MNKEIVNPNPPDNYPVCRSESCMQIILRFSRSEGAYRCDRYEMRYTW